MNAAQLENFLTERGFGNWAIKIRDGRYVFPSRKWIFGGFAEAFAVVRGQFLEKGWETDIGDCDDFADLAAFYARFLNRVEQHLERRKARDLGEEAPGHLGAALAFGTFDYLVGGEDPSQAHAINVAVVNETGAPELVFFEPQGAPGRSGPKGMRVDLTPEEVWSCLEIRF